MGNRRDKRRTPPDTRRELPASLNLRMEPKTHRLRCSFLHHDGSTQDRGQRKASTQDAETLKPKSPAGPETIETTADYLESLAPGQDQAPNRQT